MNSSNSNVENKLDLLIALTAMQAVSDLETATEKIVLLDSMGLDRSQIAKVCQSTKNAVNARLSEAKKGKKK